MKDISIIASLPEAIRFEGGSLTLEDVKVADDLEGAGLYIANALGNITIIDAEFVGNERWGIYICNMEGTGQIFMDDVSAYQNGRGGIAIVGKGSAPSFKTVCLQNIGASFNHRFGILLYDVAKTLLFNIAAGLTSSESSSFSFFGNGIAVSASDDVYLWNVTATLNEGAGYLAYGPSSTETTHLHMVGDIYGLNNAIPFAVLDGDAFLHEYTSPSQISGLCGFTSPITAPPTNAYCEKNLQPVPCTAERVDLAPPAPIQDP